MGERRVRNAGVGGSNPLPSTTCPSRCTHGPLPTTLMLDAAILGKPEALRALSGFGRGETPCAAS